MRRSNSVCYPEVGKTDVEGGCFGKLSDYPLYVENQDKGNFDILLTTDWLDHPLIFFFNNAPAAGAGADGGAQLRRQRPGGTITAMVLSLPTVGQLLFALCAIRACSWRAPS